MSLFLSWSFLCTWSLPGVQIAMSTPVPEMALPTAQIGHIKIRHTDTCRARNGMLHQFSNKLQNHMGIFWIILIYFDCELNMLVAEIAETTSASLLSESSGNKHHVHLTLIPLWHTAVDALHRIEALGKYFLCLETWSWTAVSIQCFVSFVLHFQSFWFQGQNGPFVFPLVPSFLSYGSYKVIMVLILLSAGELLSVFSLYFREHFQAWIEQSPLQCHPFEVLHASTISIPLVLWCKKHRDSAVLCSSP